MTEHETDTINIQKPDCLDLDEVYGYKPNLYNYPVEEIVFRDGYVYVTYQYAKYNDFENELIEYLRNLCKNDEDELLSIIESWKNYPNDSKQILKYLSLSNEWFYDIQKKKNDRLRRNL